MSGFVFFHEILSGVQSETGITNLSNREPEIRRLMADAEFEIQPYGSLLIKKKMIYFSCNSNFDGYKIKKPVDFVSLEPNSIKEDDNRHPLKYYENISHLVLCDNLRRNKIQMTYYAMQHDGQGNPMTTMNHKQAVIAYIVWKLYSPRVFMGIGNMNEKQYLENQFDMRCGEARGEDYMSGDAIKKMTYMNSRTSLELSLISSDHCVASDCILTITEGDDCSQPEEEIRDNITWGQFDSLTETINQPSDVDDEFLENRQEITKEQARIGNMFIYPTVGRIWFVIHNVNDIDSVKIFDSMDQDVINAMNKYYDTVNKRLIFVSKDYYTHSSIFFKFEL